MTKLYAWAIPANAIGQWADHTWVTTYDPNRAPYNSLGEVAAAGQWLWMCWGSFHPRGGTPSNPTGLLASSEGRLQFACCLVKANADSVDDVAARGTIQIYGIEGVCHQLANQILLATRGSKPAISVKGAWGYSKSVYVYGQYGLAHGAWTKAVRHCGEKTIFTEELTAMTDDFEARAREILVEKDEVLAKLMAMRGAYQVQLLHMRGAKRLTAEEIDRKHHEHMMEVAQLIGHDHFRAIFDHDPEDEMKLVDPQIYEANKRA